MLSITYIRENPNQVIEKLKIKNFDAKKLVNDIINIDEKRRELKSLVDAKQAEMNKLSKEIGIFYKNNQIDKANSAKEKTVELKEDIKNLNIEFTEKETEQINKIILLPNLPHSSVKQGKGEADNEIIKTVNTKIKATQKIPHWELAKKYDIIDFDLGNKLTGAGFPVYKGKGAKIQRALINFFLSEAEKANYNEVMPPIVVNEDSGFGTGQLPDKEGQMYYVGVDNLYLIPTAEVPVTNIYRDVILSADEFPIKQTAYTPCFRREAGSYGKDVRGLNRLHQFDKVEVVQIQHPDKSYETLQEMVDYVESLIVKLELPYRILRLCGGDLSFTSALTFDFEVYSSAQEKWLEVSSVSNFESYQANRLKLRYKEKDDKKTKLAHTLNGSALALPRILAAILENNQTENGIIIPKALKPFLNFDLIN